MSLRSGMITETTWAIDVLQVLLCDDHCITYFGLTNLPGLLDALLELFYCYLLKIFGDTFPKMHCCPKNVHREIVGQMENVNLKAEDSKDANDSGCEDDADVDFQWHRLGLKQKLPVDLPDLEKLAQASNYTLKTRDGHGICFDENPADGDIAFRDPKWDSSLSYSCSRDDFNLGLGDTCVHVLTHFESCQTSEILLSKFSKWNLSSSTAVKKGDLDEQSVKSQNSNVGSKASSRAPTPPIKATSPHPDLDEDLDVKDIKIEVALSAAVDPENGSSRDSGLHLKSETSEGNQEHIKMELDVVENGHEDVKPTEEPSEDKPEEAPEAKPEPTPSGFDNFQDLIRECNENDKRYLERLRRKWEEIRDMDREEFRGGQPVLRGTTEAKDELSQRCIAISNIYRSLSFVAGNDREMSRHMGLMRLLGHLMLFKHHHLKLDPAKRTYKDVDEVDTDEVTDDLQVKDVEWWWHTLDALRENVLVIFANISGHMNLSVFPEDVCMPILEGLLHWSICPSAYAQDPMPTMPSRSPITPQSLVLEALSKLCVTDINVDLILATPPFSRIVSLFGILIKMLADESDQVMCEFSIALLSSLVQGDQSAARAIALQHPAISLLISFIERAEQTSLQIIANHGPQLLIDNPEAMGTSVEMLRKAAKTLHHLAVVQENRMLFTSQQDRLLNLVMSSVLDKQTVSTLSTVLFHSAPDP